MTSLWIEIKKAVQLYSDPFFASVKRLQEFDDVSLIKNRLQLFESMNDFMIEYTIHDASFVFSIATSDGKTVETQQLLNETEPELGYEFTQCGDRLTFERIKKNTEPELFRLGGLFFQEILLPGIAGFNKRTVDESNANNRESMLYVLELLFRLPEDVGLVQLRVGPRSGRCRIVQAQELRSIHTMRLFDFLTAAKVPAAHPPSNGMATSSSETPQQLSDPLVCQNNVVGANGRLRETDTHSSSKKRSHEESYANVHAWLAEDLAPTPRRTSRHSSTEALQSPLPIMPAPKQRHTTTSSNSSTRRQEAPVSPPTVPNLRHPHSGHQWSTEHELVGTRIAAERTVPVIRSGSSEESSLAPRVICKGAVASYRTIESGTIQRSRTIFKVKWSDPRLPWEEMSRTEVLQGSRMFDEIEGWTVSNPSVGQRVAGIFPHQRRVPSCATGQIIPLSRAEDVYAGKVVKYQHPSSPRAGDQLYHIQWCDGDVEDLDQNQLHEAQQLYMTHRSRFSAV